MLTQVIGSEKTNGTGGLQQRISSTVLPAFGIENPFHLELEMIFIPIVHIPLSLSSQILV